MRRYVSFGFLYFGGYRNYPGGFRIGRECVLPCDLHTSVYLTGSYGLYLEWFNHFAVYNHNIAQLTSWSQVPDPETYFDLAGIPPIFI